MHMFWQINHNLFISHHVVVVLRKSEELSYLFTLTTTCLQDRVFHIILTIYLPC